MGQTKVVQFPHVYHTETRSYDVTLTATILAPNIPFLHQVQYTSNYTIATSDVVCFATTGISNYMNDTDNIFEVDDDFVPPTPSKIDEQNTTSTESGEISSSSSLSSIIMVPFYGTIAAVFLTRWE